MNALSTFIEVHVTLMPNGDYNIANLLMPSALPQFVVLVIMVLFSPFLISLLLTKREPDLKIVPPAYIAIIGFAWMLIFWFFPFDLLRGFFMFLFGSILFSSGLVEDKLVTSILGIATERECIYFEHLTVFAEIDDVKARFSVPEIRDVLALSDRVEGDAERGYILRTKRGYSFINRISLAKDKEFPDQVTNVKIVSYERGRYNLRVSSTFLEDSRKTSAYVKDIFLNRQPAMVFEVITPFANNMRDSLIDSIIDEMYGYYVKSKRLSTGDLVKVGALVGVFIMTVVLFVIDQPFFGGLSAILDALFALSELPDIVRRQT